MSWMQATSTCDSLSILSLPLICSLENVNNSYKKDSQKQNQPYYPAEQAPIFGLLNAPDSLS